MHQNLFPKTFKRTKIIDQSLLISEFNTMNQRKQTLYMQQILSFNKEMLDFVGDEICRGKGVFSTNEA